MSQLQHLPPLAVPYLDALCRPEGDPKVEHPGFLRLLQQFEDWLDFQSGYTLDDAEADHLENVRTLLESLRTTVEETGWNEQLQPLIRDLYPLVALMDHIGKRRETPHFSAQPAVNDFLMCGAAYLQQRADWTALARRHDNLLAYLEVLRQAYRGVKSELRPEVTEELDRGFQHLKAGLEPVTRLGEAISGDELHDSLAAVSEGAGIIQFLIDWRRQSEESWLAAHPRWLIPMAGSQLQSGLELARELPREQWRRGIKGLREEVVPAVAPAWEKMRRRIFLDPEERLGLWEDVDAGLEELELALDDLEDPELAADDALDAFEDACEQLSETFQEIRTRALPYSHLYDSSAGVYLDSIFGALGGTVPWVRLLFLLNQQPPIWEGVGPELEAYGRDGDPDHLFRAGYALLKQNPPSGAEAAEGGADWTCPFCGAANPLGQRSCSGCQSSSMGGSVLAWSEA